ncbi:MAG TPA: ATP-binding cassette domain-containing protein [Alphaproteobacteria bacterium]|nr:ATP-binding cassette domain-containing protein [Alphaproteobacteria bacterium]HQS94535.1 ATP-binding cassette domain-containing protein [Alphaproteobacteria bacterium]
MQKEIIQFDQVSLDFPGNITVFENISFRLLEGTFHFLTGASGSGKSSLLNLIHLSMRPTKGHIRLLGYDVSAIKRSEIPFFRSQISFVFQDFRLLDHLTALENVVLPLRLQGVPFQKCRLQALELLKWVGLEGFYEAYPPTLSGGQKQRIAIARAVITQPKVLLADEPTGNVDDQTGVKLLYLFEELNKNGTTVLVATHNQLLPQEFSYPQLYLDRHKISLILPAEGETLNGF